MIFAIDGSESCALGLVLNNDNEAWLKQILHLQVKRFISAKLHCHYSKLSQERNSHFHQ
jgi:hypothetical protein